MKEYEVIELFSRAIKIAESYGIDYIVVSRPFDENLPIYTLHLALYDEENPRIVANMQRESESFLENYQIKELKLACVEWMKKGFNND